MAQDGTKESPRKPQFRGKMFPHWRKIAPSWPQSRPRRLRRRPKKAPQQAPDDSLIAQDVFQMTPMGIRIASREAKKTRGQGQDCSMLAQECSKVAAEWPRTAPKRAQDSSRTGSIWFHDCSRAFRDSPNVAQYDLKASPRKPQHKLKMVP